MLVLTSALLYLRLPMSVVFKVLGCPCSKKLMCYLEEVQTAFDPPHNPQPVVPPNPTNPPLPIFGNFVALFKENFMNKSVRLECQNLQGNFLDWK